DTSMLSNDTVFDPVATMDRADTTYFPFEIVSPDGCEKKDSFLVVVSNTPKPEAVITGDSTICKGDSSKLIAEVVNISGNKSDDFNSGYDTSLWSTINGGTVNSDCGSMSGDALHFDGSTTREALTKGMDMLNCDTLKYCLRLGDGASPCETLDSGEDIEVEFSTDGGSTWTNLSTYTDASQAANAWTCYNIPIPGSAQTSNTIFRWRQLSAFNGSGNDNWALDNVEIICSGNDSTFAYNWSPSLSLTNDTGSSTESFTTSDTTYTVVVNDTVGECSDTSKFEVSVVQNFNFTSSQSDTNICKGEQVQFNINADTALASLIKNWQPGGFFSDTSIADPVGTFNNSGTQTVSV
ncbi:MAG: hypothetical protein ABEH43_05740, partial [Flavobacteriales bacterium]